jgi:hypothetical protein
LFRYTRFLCDAVHYRHYRTIRSQSEITNAIKHIAATYPACKVCKSVLAGYSSCDRPQRRIETTRLDNFAKPCLGLSDQLDQSIEIWGVGINRLQQFRQQK